MSQFSQKSAADHNQRAWDALAREGQRFTTAAKDEEFKNPLQILDGNNWLGGSLQGKKLLCLAAGGGRQAPLYAATGAQVTVVDISPSQLELDRQVAAERNLDLKTVQTSMDDLTMFADAEFDVVVHPVSSCYLPNLELVYQQIARITTSGGLYISQHKQPVSLQSSTEFSNAGYTIDESYFRSDPLPQVQGSLHREEGTMEFVHRWEVLIGSMCRAGFSIEDLIEPRHADPNSRPGTFAHRSNFIPPYVRIKARRNQHSSSKSVWIP